MPTRRKNIKPPTRSKNIKPPTKTIEDILSNLSQAEGEVARQERFSAAGTNYGPGFVSAEEEASPIADAPMAAPVDAAGVDDVGGAGEAPEVPGVGEAPDAVPVPIAEPVFEELERKNIQGNIFPQVPYRYLYML